MMTLVTGGAKCGKSHFAEKIFYDFAGSKFYIATMQPYGDEAISAIERHRKIRAGKGFETIEKYTDIEETEFPENCGILLECTANLCANEMFRKGKICDPTDKIICGYEHLKSCSEMFVIVTNDVGSDGIFYEKNTAEYIKIMGKINAKAAEIADNVIECIYGIPVPLKGRSI